jgi:hypothetical protein
MRLMALMLCVAVAGCGGNEETTTVTTADGDEVRISQSKDSDGENGTITFEGKDGEGKITFGDGAAGQPLPLGLPVYPGGTVKGTFTGSGGSGNVGGMATIVSTDAADKVVAYYKEQAQARGFAIKSQTTSTTEKGSVASFTAEGKGGGTLIVTATPQDEGGTAAVIIGNSKN